MTGVEEVTTTVAPGSFPAAARTLTSAADDLRSGAVSSVELTTESLARADRLDDLLGVYITRLDEVAVADAERADAELARGVDRGPLQGIPLGVKDIIAVAGSATTAQSLVLDGGWGEGWGDAPVVARLRAAGAVITGKAATLEFAIGIADPAKPFPIHRNPWNVDRWPGGSSAGTGTGVAAGLFLGGLGTDTGGSVRIPAAMCGISGLKQTYGLVPKSGCVPLGYSLDHIGPMARSAADCAALLAVMAGPDPSDPTVAPMPGGLTRDLAGLAADPPTDLEGVVVGVDRVNHLDAPNIAPGAVDVFEAAVARLSALGATVVEVALPHYAEGNVADIVVMVCEAASYHGMDLRSRWSDYGAPTRKVLSWAAAYSGADYVQAQRVRSAALAGCVELLRSVDVVVHPTTLFPAPTLAEADVDNWFDWPLFTSYGNSVGLPALSIPMGFVDGMPLGLTVMAAPFAEPTVLGVGAAYQSATDHHLAIPPVVDEVPA